MSNWLSHLESAILQYYSLRGVSADLFFDVLYTLTVILLLILLQQFFILLFSKNFIATDQRENLNLVSRHTLLLVASIFLIKTWLTGKSSLITFLGIQARLGDRWIDSMITLVVLFFGQKIIRDLLQLFKQGYTRRYTINKTAQAVFSFVIVLVIARIWLIGRLNLSTYLGLLSAGLAIALRDLLINMAGWLYIVIIQPFKVGQRIEINNLVGEVVDIRLFQFSLLEVGKGPEGEMPSGRLQNIPNGHIFRFSVANYNSLFDFVWSELSLTLTFESNWTEMITQLKAFAQTYHDQISHTAQRQIKKAAHNYMIADSQLEPQVLVSYKEYGVVLTLRYLVRPLERPYFDSQLWQKIIEHAQKNAQIKLATPLHRVINQTP